VPLRVAPRPWAGHRQRTMSPDSGPAGRASGRSSLLRHVCRNDRRPPAGPLPLPPGHGLGPLQGLASESHGPGPGTTRLAEPANLKARESSVRVGGTAGPPPYPHRTFSKSLRFPGSPRLPHLAPPRIPGCRELRSRLRPWRGRGRGGHAAGRDMKGGSRWVWWPEWMGAWAGPESRKNSPARAMTPSICLALSSGASIDRRRAHSRHGAACACGRQKGSGRLPPNRGCAKRS
jgi:hypothetical protein